METEIKNALQVLENGGTILYPTDTIWGIGCDATNTSAVEKVYKIKKRTETKSLIVLLSDIDQLKNYVSEVPDTIYDFLSEMMKPVTVIYPGAMNLAKNVIAADQTIGIRIVRDKFCQSLINVFGKPIVSTSANISSHPTPLFFGKISPEIIKGVDYVVNWDQKSVNQLKASTILKLLPNGEFQIIRS